MSPRIAALMVILAAALFLVAGAGAGTQPPKKLDLTNPSAIDSYLQSLGVDPATVIKQVGLRNYAGPNCPGLGWNCTTATTVVQIALAGGENTTECSGKPEDTTTFTEGDQSCIIVQTAPDKGENRAKCHEKSDDPVVVQTCVITQDNVGGGNHADVNQLNHATEGSPTASLEQDAQQAAHVVQDSDGGDNHSDIHQSVQQSLDEGADQQQDAHQVAFVSQSVTGSGNFSHVHQSQDQLGSGAATTQDQNTEPAPTLTIGTLFINFDCGPEKVAEPNQCANVFQDGTLASSGANNQSHLHQAIGEREVSTLGTGTQTQGRFDGGQEGNVHQQNPDGLGLNHDAAHQDTRQHQSSPAGTKFQQQLTDPGCCGVSQVGAAKNREYVNQSTTQSATEDDAFQTALLVGQVHQVSDPENLCKIDHHGRNNSDAAHFTASGEGLECANLVLVTQCTSGGESAETCEPTEPPCVECELTVVSFPTTPTSGRDIQMPDYNAEPSDYSASP